MKVEEDREPQGKAGDAAPAALGWRGLSREPISIQLGPKNHVFAKRTHFLKCQECL
ncbi:MAG: hypothetical protein ABSG78_17025 [Verrucomicrobiota bacterium]|jgi:hypothetical protein